MCLLLESELLSQKLILLFKRTISKGKLSNLVLDAVDLVDHLSLLFLECFQPLIQLADGLLLGLDITHEHFNVLVGLSNRDLALLDLVKVGLLFLLNLVLE